MDIKDANYYRDRPSGEIRKEQLELQALRDESYKKGEAFWQWNGYTGLFEVSKAWEKLTGYKATELFPSEPPNVPIETLLDHYIRKWLKLVAPGDREEAEDYANRFLLENSTDNYFDHNYRFKFKDGRYRHILTTARTVWQDKKLISLFVQTRVLNVKPSDIAAQTAHNTKAIADAQQQTQKEKVAKAKLSTRVKNFVPVALATTLAFNEAGGWKLLKDFKDNISVLVSPAEIQLSPRLSGDDFDLDFLSDVRLYEIKQVLRKHSLDTTQISLGVYTPGIAPAKYRVIMQLEGGQMQQLPTEAQNVSNDIFTTARTESHLNRQRYNPVVGPYSVPIFVERRRRRWQVFFVESQVKTKNSDALSYRHEGTEEAAVEIESILKKAVSEYAPPTPTDSSSNRP